MDFLKKLFGKGPDKSEQVENTKIEVPFEHIIVHGGRAIEKFNELRKSPEVTPIIMGSPKDINLLIENFELAEKTFEEIVEASHEVHFPQWFSERIKDDEEYYELPHGDWPEEQLPNVSLSAHLDIVSGKPHEEVIVGLLPVKESWEVPAFLKIGGWNECPFPHEHVAIFRKWKQEYSADVACVTGDVIEFVVENPPTSKEQAMKLAEEQFVYCADIVFQGVETIENLAATLIKGQAWYFWWD